MARLSGPALAMLLAFLIIPSPLAAQHQGRTHAAARHHTSKAHASPSARSHATPAPGTRDRHGRLERSEQATRDFMRQTGHPHGWAGHVIDHKVPLACGGEIGRAHV